jgi:hypothetical protein
MKFIIIGCRNGHRPLITTPFESAFLIRLDGVTRRDQRNTTHNTSGNRHNRGGGECLCR